MAHGKTTVRGRERLARDNQQWVVDYLIQETGKVFQKRRPEDIQEGPIAWRRGHYSSGSSVFPTMLWQNSARGLSRSLRCRGFPGLR